MPTDSAVHAVEAGRTMSEHRPLGLTSATALVVAAMIGTGVFTTSGLLLEDLRSPRAVLAVWALGGVIAMLGALSYGALGRRLPESGGEYWFLTHTVHPAAGYVAGWVSLLVGFAAPAAASAYAFGRYVAPWFPGSDPRLAGGALLLTCAVLHALPAGKAARVQSLGVGWNLALILGFLALALPRVRIALPDLGDPVGSADAAARFGVALIVVSYSYAGWNAAVYVGGEIRDPARNLPRALLLGTLMVTALYVALNWVFVYSASVSELAGQVEVGRIAAEQLGGPAWGAAVSALIALVLMMSVSSFLMAGPRVVARMARDGHLPRWLSATGDGPPWRAVVAQAAIALAMLATVTFAGLLTYVGLTLGLMTAATVGGLIRMRLREGERMPVPGWPRVPGLFLLAVLGSCGATVVERPAAAAASLGTVALGLAAWRFRGRRTSG